ncbi:MAG: hypothetical protein NC548_25150 [Lachnospiraceae bacterium]|nr:hypothetical protein [Lachnospiraceae bacterium]
MRGTDLGTAGLSLGNRNGDGRGFTGTLPQNLHIRAYGSLWFAVGRGTDFEKVKCRLF